MRLGVLAAVRFDEADDDVDALLLQTPRAFEHGEGLADARRHAEIDLEAAAALRATASARSASGSGRAARGLGHDDSAMASVAQQVR